MPDVLYVDDQFAGLAVDANLAGRIPTVSNTSQTYGVDPSSTAITGAASNTIKFNANGAVFKIRQSNTPNVAVQVVYNDNSANETLNIFLRDNQSTPAHRYGYGVRVRTREFGGTSGYFRVYSTNNYVATSLFADFPWTFASSGVNKIAFEANSTNFRVIINDTLATSFSDSTYPADAIRDRCGVSFTSTSPSTLRVSRFSIYDSLVLTSLIEYPVVRFG